MKKFAIEIKWALIFVITGLIWMLFEKLAGFHGVRIDKHEIVTNFFAIPAIAIYVFALLDKRKSFYSGVMTYKQGFMTGLIITIIVTIVTPFWQLINSTIISPEYFPNIIEYSVSQGIMTREEA